MVKLRVKQKIIYWNYKQLESTSVLTIYQRPVVRGQWQCTSKPLWTEIVETVWEKFQQSTYGKVFLLFIKLLYKCVSHTTFMRACHSIRPLLFIHYCGSTALQVQNKHFCMIYIMDAHRLHRDKQATTSVSIRLSSTSTDFITCLFSETSGDCKYPSVHRPIHRHMLSRKLYKPLLWSIRWQLYLSHLSNTIFFAEHKGHHDGCFAANKNVIWMYGV